MSSQINNVEEKVAEVEEISTEVNEVDNNEKHQEQNVNIPEEVKEEVNKLVNVLTQSVLEKVRELTQEDVIKLMREDETYGVSSSIVLPNTTSIEGEEKINAALKANEEDKKFYSAKEKHALWAAAKGYSIAATDYRYDEDNSKKGKLFKSEGDYVIEYKTKDAEIKIKNLDFLSLMQKTPEDKKASEDMVMHIFNSVIASGEIIKIPLWHSGFSVDINPPTINDIVETQNAINESLTELGFETGNLIFSNLSGVVDKHIIDLFMKLLIKCTADVEKENVLEHISVLDFPSIVLGILASMYPQGTMFTVSCSNVLDLENNRPKCDYIAEAKIDFKKFLNVDKGRIDAKVKPYISNFLKLPSKSVPLTTVQKYQEELFKSDLVKQEIVLKETGRTFNLHLKIPSIKEYLEVSELYINELEKRVVNAMGSNYDERETITSFIISMTYITIFSAFIDYISINDGETGKDMRLEDRENIYGALLGLSSVGNDPSIVNNKVIDFINDVMVTAIGIDEYECPKCKKLNKRESSAKHIVMLSMEKTFFSLATLRTLKAVGEIKH